MEGNEEWRSFKRPARTDSKFAPGKWEVENVPEPSGKMMSAKDMHKNNTPAGKTYSSDLSRRRRKEMCDILKKNGYWMTGKEIARSLNAAPRNSWVTGILRMLVAEGLVERHGNSEYKWIGEI